MSSDLENLARRLSYDFRDTELLKRAVTHCSKSADNNERLEFLGDSVLNFTISALLYDRYSNLEEGELTRLRASLVKKEALAQRARALGLGEFLLLGAGEMKSGGFDRDSILADSLEAVFGAIFIDGGIGQARSVIRGVYRDVLDSVTPHTLEKDPKTRLQEYLQKRVLATPAYSVVEVTGEAHKQSFRVQCVVPGLEQPVEGIGRSRRLAEQEAASKILEQLDVPSGA
ncbi:MAG: ribonuclease III [Acidiferrobacterales bacterium]